MTITKVEKVGNTYKWGFNYYIKECMKNHPNKMQKALFSTWPVSWDTGKYAIPHFIPLNTEHIVETIQEAVEKVTSMTKFCLEKVMGQ